MKIVIVSSILLWMELVIMLVPLSTQLAVVLAQSPSQLTTQNPEGTVTQSDTSVDEFPRTSSSFSQTQPSFPAPAPSLEPSMWVPPSDAAPFSTPSMHSIGTPNLPTNTLTFSRAISSHDDLPISVVTSLAADAGHKSTIVETLSVVTTSATSIALVSQPNKRHSIMATQSASTIPPSSPVINRTVLSTTYVASDMNSIAGVQSSVSHILAISKKTRVYMLPTSVQEQIYTVSSQNAVIDHISAGGPTPVSRPLPVTASLRAPSMLAATEADASTRLSSTSKTNAPLAPATRDIYTEVSPSPLTGSSLETASVYQTRNTAVFTSYASDYSDGLYFTSSPSTRENIAHVNATVSALAVASVQLTDSTFFKSVTPGSSTSLAALRDYKEMTTLAPSGMIQNAVQVQTTPIGLSPLLSTDYLLAMTTGTAAIQDWSVHSEIPNKSEAWSESIQTVSMLASMQDITASEQVSTATLSTFDYSGHIRSNTPTLDPTVDETLSSDNAKTGTRSATVDISSIMQVNTATLQLPISHSMVDHSIATEHVFDGVPTDSWRIYASELPVVSTPRLADTRTPLLASSMLNIQDTINEDIVITTITAYPTLLTSSWLYIVPTPVSVAYITGGLQMETASSSMPAFSTETPSIHSVTEPLNTGTSSLDVSGATAELTTPAYTFTNETNGSLTQGITHIFTPTTEDPKATSVGGVTPRADLTTQNATRIATEIPNTPVPPEDTNEDINDLTTEHSVSNETVATITLNPATAKPSSHTTSASNRPTTHRYTASLSTDNGTVENNTTQPFTAKMLTTDTSTVASAPWTSASNAAVSPVSVPVSAKDFKGTSEAIIEERTTKSPGTDSPERTTQVTWNHSATYDEYWSRTAANQIQCPLWDFSGPKALLSSLAVCARVQSASAPPGYVGTRENGTTGGSYVTTAELVAGLPDEESLPVNTSEAYWVKTIIEVPVATTVENNATFITMMERRLAIVFNDALQEEVQPFSSRRRRHVTVYNATVQMTNTTRAGGAAPEHTSLVYYFVEDWVYNNITHAARTVQLINSYSLQQLAIALGYVVVVKGELYLPLPPPEDKKLWIIGAVIGGIVGLLLLGWLIMFIYFKCTRPPPRRKSTSARSPRGLRLVDGEPQLTEAKKDIKGFDYVRTEVGMENELEKKKLHDYYRKYPLGSAELEGMYSPGETPPPRYRGQPPVSSAQYAAPVGRGSKGRGRPPSYGRGYPPSGPDSLSGYTSAPPGTHRPLPGQHTTTEQPPRERLEEDYTSGETSGTVETERSEDRRPLSKKKVKKPHRSGSKPTSRQRESDQALTDDMQAGQFENVAKLSRMDEFPSEPHSQIRTTLHAIKLPELANAQHTERSTEDTAWEQQNLQESLKQKADIERWRNKQRQREHKKAAKKHTPNSDSKEERRAYDQAQRQIGAVLGGGSEAPDRLPDVFVIQPPRKKKKKRKKQRKDESMTGSSPDSLEMRPVLPSGYDHGDIQATSLDHHHDLGHLETDTSSDEPEVKGQSELEEARQRIHVMLDEAFALVTPHRRQRMSPGLLGASSLLPPPAHGRASNPVARSSRRQFLCLPEASRNGSHLDSENEAAPTTHTIDISPEDHGPKHTPVYVSPVTRSRDAPPETSYNPYLAADEAHQITSTQQVPQNMVLSQELQWRSQSQPPESPHGAAQANSQQYDNRGYLTDGAQFNSGVNVGSRSLPVTSVKPARTAHELRGSLQPDNYTSVLMDSSLIAPASKQHNPDKKPHQAKSPKAFVPYRRSSAVSPMSDHSKLGSLAGTDSLGNLTVSSLDGFVTASSHSNQTSHENTPEREAVPVNNGHSSPGRRDQTDDEIDIANDVLKPGATSAPLVSSIRDELEKIAQRATDRNTITDFNVNS